jgi:glycosyltransferase involved in cell wall biosynthesis
MQPAQYSEVAESGLPNARQISICHIVTADLWAGAEVQIATLLGQLSRQSDLSLSVIALGAGRLVEELRAASLEVRVITQPHGRFSACYRESCKFLRERDVQVLHSHKSKENVLAFLLAKQLAIPYLVRTQHGLPEPKTLKDRLVYGLERMTGSSTNHTISVSSELRLRSHVDPQKITVIRNGIDLQKVTSSLRREAAKRRLGIGEHVPVVGIGARLEAVKRIDLFLATAQHISAGCLCNGLPNAFFLVAGDGRERPHLEELIRGTALESQTSFLGHRNDVCDVVRAMDLLLITSDHEGIPTIALEAMALGTPVVSRKVGGMPEVIEDQVSGVLVDTSDPARIAQACIRVLTTESFAHRLTRAAREEVVRDFSAETNASKVANIYRSLVSGSANLLLGDVAE